MKIAARILAAFYLILLVAGCADDQPEQGNPNASTIPWNHPLPGEGQGPMGGFNQGHEGSTGH